MENPHHRRHPKLDATVLRKVTYEKRANRRMNNTLPKKIKALTAPASPVVLLSVTKQILMRPGQEREWWHFPLYEPSCVGASHLGVSMFMQVKALNWIGQETGEVTYTPLGLGGWKCDGWRTRLTRPPTPFGPQK
jgi:hypothetical protein